MIEKKTAAAQVGRMVGLNYFPTEKKGQDELVEALMNAASPEVCKSVVDDWIASNADRPTPADIHRLAGEANAAATRTRAHCERCGGSGSITGWYLVTYKGQSFQMRSSAFLREIDSNEKATAYILRLKEFQERNPDADRQTVITAARSCGCRGAQ